MSNAPFHAPSPDASPRGRSASLRRPAAAACRGPRRAAACEWLDRCLSSRCDESWRRLLNRHGPRIRRIVARIGLDHGLDLRQAEVEELCQELFLYWLRRGSRFDGQGLGQFWSFVTASVRHLVIDRVRYLTADKRALECDPWLRVLPFDQVETGSLGPARCLAASSTATPESRLVRREERQRLRSRFLEHCRRVVDGEGDVDVLVQAVLDGRSSRELSRELRRAGRLVCRSTLDSWVHRLRSRLAAEGLHLPRREREPEGAWPARTLAETLPS